MRKEDFNKLDIGQLLYYVDGNTFRCVRVTGKYVYLANKDLDACAKGINPPDFKSFIRPLLYVSDAPSEGYDWNASCDMFSLEAPSVKEYKLTRYGHYFIDGDEFKYCESQKNWSDFLKVLNGRYPGDRNVKFVKTVVIEEVTHNEVIK